MKKYSVPVIILVIMGFLLLGGRGTIAQQPQQQKGTIPKLLTLATHPVGTLLNTFGTALATVLSKNLPTSVKVMPTTGPTEWLPMIISGEVDFGILNNWDAKNGRHGREEYKAATAGKGSPIYLLCSGTPNFGGVLTSEASGIKKGSDLKGKRVVCIFTGSAGVSGQARANLANFGLTTSDVKVVSVPGVEAGVRAIIEGRADATGSAGLGMATNNELEADKGARYLSLDPSPEAFQRMQEHYPCYKVQVNPGPGMVGIKEPTYLMAYDFYLVGSEKMSPDVAYSLVKTLWEFDKDLAPIHIRLKDWTKDRYVTKTATIPYHPGAVRFYKEIGAWGAEMDSMQKKLLEEK